MWTLDIHWIYENDKKSLCIYKSDKTLINFKYFKFALDRGKILIE